MPHPADASHRRTFLKSSTALAAGLPSPTLPAQTQHTLPALPQNPHTADAMPTRNLGQGQMTALDTAAAPVARQSLFFRSTDRSKG